MVGEENLKIMRHWCYCLLLKAKHWAPECKERWGDGGRSFWSGHPHRKDSKRWWLHCFRVVHCSHTKHEGRKYSFETCLVLFPQKWSPWPCSRSWTGNGCWRLSQPSSQSLTTCLTLPTLIVSTTTSLNAWPSYLLFAIFYVVYGYTCMYILTCMRVNKNIMISACPSVLQFYMGVLLMRFEVGSLKLCTLVTHLCSSVGDHDLISRSQEHQIAETENCNFLFFRSR